MANGTLDSQAEEIARLNNYTSLQNQLALIQKNLQKIAKPIIVKTIPMSEGNLYQVAAQYYGDPFKWKIIADANNLTDPEITEFINLVIPLVTNKTNP